CAHQYLSVAKSSVFLCVFLRALCVSAVNSLRLHDRHLELEAEQEKRGGHLGVAGEQVLLGDRTLGLGGAVGAGSIGLLLELGLVAGRGGGIAENVELFAGVDRGTHLIG